jgi:pilus assembly protein Flp/PilA
MLKKIKHASVSFMTDESGQDLIEYALVAGLVGVGAIAAASGLIGSVANAVKSTGHGISNSI